MSTNDSLHDQASWKAMSAEPERCPTCGSDRREVDTLKLSAASLSDSVLAQAEREAGWQAERKLWKEMSNRRQGVYGTCAHDVLISENCQECSGPQPIPDEVKK